MYKVLTLLLVLITIGAHGQLTGSFVVGGDLDKFYPVTFRDEGWAQNVTTAIEIGRSNVHQDGEWRGSVIAKFLIHTSNWGNGSSFINADISQNNNIMLVNTREFIAGWSDVSLNNSSYRSIIWLRGGATTYYYKSNVSTNPVVYDGTQNPLPLLIENMGNYTYKKSVDGYVNSRGSSIEGTAYFTGTSRNYFAGNVGIGTDNPTEKLAVNGNIRAREVKVETANWPDYVFDSEYKSLSLSDLESFIKANKHLPDMPKAISVEKNGINIGEMNAKLLKKIEELTLYLIAKDKEISILKEQQKHYEAQQNQIDQLQKQFEILVKKNR